MAAQLKLKSAQHLAQPLARLLAASMLELDAWALGRVAVVPVPTAKPHARERGLDHTKLVAKELARIMGWRYLEILRRRNEAEQRGESKRVRRAQAKSAYAVAAGYAVGGEKSASGNGLDEFDTIILYDDITTTGATLEECVKILRAAGARNVNCVVLAKTR
jgi:ComF family protein